MAVIIDSARDHPLMASVMVVDDQHTGRAIIETVLRGIGENIRVKCYRSPLEALATAESEVPDLIVADYKMPELNGVEFLKRIRQLPACRDVPVVIVTVVDDRDVLYEALEAGATDFLTKPVDHYECKVRCRNLLTMRRQQIIIRNRAASLETQIARSVEEIHERERETLLRLARAGEFRDYVSSEQLARIGRLSGAIATELGLGETFRRTIEQSAPLHDIGKIGIPDHVLSKSGSLTEAEREIIKTHTRVGYEILRDSPSPFIRMGATIALSHHESFDGSGYPDGLAGDGIPIEARIVAVSDILDALLSHRPYKRPWPLDAALAEITRLRGTRLDPRCVDALFTCIEAHLPDFLPDHRDSRSGGGI